METFIEQYKLDKFFPFELSECYDIYRDTLLCVSADGRMAIHTDVILDEEHREALVDLINGDIDYDDFTDMDEISVRLYNGDFDFMINEHCEVIAVKSSGTPVNNPFRLRILADCITSLSWKPSAVAIYIASKLNGWTEEEIMKIVDSAAEAAEDIDKLMNDLQGKGQEGDGRFFIRTKEPIN